MNLIKYVIVNGLFGASVYYGFFEGVEGALNIAYFYAWLCSIVSLLATEETVKALAEKGKKPSVPKWINAVFDISISCVFVWFGAWVTGLFYMIHLVKSSDLWSKVAEYENTPPQPTHNAPKPPEEGDCIGGEGGGV